MAFPTETVYGLGADALDAAAVEKIFEVKGRPVDNPIIVHIARKEDVFKYAKVYEREKVLVDKLIEKFWPGPLTLILKKASQVPDAVTAGLDSVAIRMPSHPVALGLIRAAGVPIAAPSANVSGRPSPTDAEHVLDDLNGQIPLLIDSGPTEIGLESTVVDLTVEPPMLMRPGGVSLEDLTYVLRNISIHPSIKMHEYSAAEAAKAPGMKYRHYAPDVELVVIEGSPNKIGQKISDLVNDYRKEGKKTAILGLGSQNPDVAAKELFKQLRTLEKSVDVIIVEGLPEAGVGLAVMNRLRKAASKLIKV